MNSLEQKKIGIALMDRYPLTLNGLSSFISILGIMNKITMQETRIGAVVDKLLYQPTDVLITELNGVNETLEEGKKALLDLCAQLPTLKVLVYTRCQNGEELRTLLKMKNISVISREDNLKQVGEFFNRVFSGERVLSPKIGTYLAQSERNELTKSCYLTRCENDVLNFLFNGMSLRQISELQRRSIKTISAHKCNAMRKLQVRSDSELFSLERNITKKFADSYDPSFF